MTTNLLNGLVLQELPTVERDGVAAAEALRKNQKLRAIYSPSNQFTIGSMNRVERDPIDAIPTVSKLQKSMLNALDGPDDALERLAFERDPQRISSYAGIYRPKLQGVPDSLLKRMAICDDLVASIVHTRSNHIGQFGRKQIDRHSKGFKLIPDEHIVSQLDAQGKKRLQERIARAEKLLLTCGNMNGWSEQEKCSFSEFLYMQTRNCVVVGRMATEIIWIPDSGAPGDAERRKFHSFRPVDAGTIYFATPYHEIVQQVRESALRMLENLKNEKLKKEEFENEEYAWIQVFEGRPMQAFGSQEMLVHSPCNVTDIEQMGYPVAPLDTVISAVTTHLNITNHNRLYFQSGRASKGMLIVKSADIDPDIVMGIKQQFNASINSVSNSWRMPVFGVGAEDDIKWAPIDSGGGRDMEFQYLSDANARTILSAFQMSPEELPGYAHLSRGTNSQALSENNTEYQLTAARDVGIRPLLASFEDFLNSSIIPLIDPELSKVVKLKLAGLDVDTEEKESVRLSQDMGVWMNFNDILAKLEKKPLPRKLAADIPLNQAYFQYLQLFVPFGTIMKELLGYEDGEDPQKHPDWQFFMNPFWQQEHQMQMQMQMQAMQQQQQQQQGQQPPAPTSGPGTQVQGGTDLSSGVDQLLQLVAKSEGFNGENKAESLVAKAKRLRVRSIASNRAIMDSFVKDMECKVKRIADIATNTRIPGKK
jgi:hypothetical protein